MKSELSLQALIQTLRDKAPIISCARLDETLQRVVVRRGEVERFAFFSQKHYARNLVYANQEFEVMIMCWRNGQRSSIHDHAGSLGGIKILQGTLTESLFERAPNGMIKSLDSQDYDPGNRRIEETTLIHQISNLQAERHDAISLHIYVPPLTRMNVFSLYDTAVRTVLPQHFIFGAGI